MTHRLKQQNKIQKNIDTIKLPRLISPSLLLMTDKQPKLFMFLPVILTGYIMIMTNRVCINMHTRSSLFFFLFFVIRGLNRIYLIPSCASPA